MIPTATPAPAGPSGARLGTVDRVVTLREHAARAEREERGDDRAGRRRARRPGRAPPAAGSPRPCAAAARSLIAGHAHAERAQIVRRRARTSPSRTRRPAPRPAGETSRPGAARRPPRARGLPGAEPARRHVLQLAVDLAQVGVALRRALRRHARPRPARAGSSVARGVGGAPAAAGATAQASNSTGAAHSAVGSRHLTRTAPRIR